MALDIFDKIAPIYNLFFNFQVKYYKKILANTKQQIDLSKYETALDIGCGTGAYCYVLNDIGLSVVGTDIADGMIKQAKKNLINTDIEIVKIDPQVKFPFEDNSFDILISSYVVHGLKKEDRIKLYKEARRISKELIIFHDYNKNRALLTTIIEYLENGDYFNFIKVAEDEMKEYFTSLKVINVDKRGAWYILTK